MHTRWKMALWLVPSALLLAAGVAAWAVTQHVNNSATEWTALGVVVGVTTLMAALLGLPLAIAQLSVVERELSRLLPVPAMHYQALRGMLDQCRMSVHRQALISFGDAAGGLELNRRAFDAHFTELVPLVVDWNEAVADVAAALQAFELAITKAADEHGVVDPPFAREDILNNLQVRYGPSLHLAVEDWGPNPVTPIGNGQIGVAGITTRIRDAPPELTEDDLRQLASPVINLCDAVRHLPEIGQVAEAQDALTNRIRPFIDAIALVAAAESVALNPECPICQRNL